MVFIGTMTILWNAPIYELVGGFKDVLLSIIYMG